MGSGGTFVKKKVCPVVGHTVSLKGMRAAREGKSIVVKSTCSNITDCIEKQGSTDRIPGCLLYKLV
jgi:hypothetical protein